MWDGKSTLLALGYPKHAKEHPAGQVNIDRALTAYRIESESSRLATNTEGLKKEEDS